MAITQASPVLLDIVEPAAETGSTAAVTVQELLQEFEQVAWVIAGAKLDDTSWTQLRAQVVDLIQRGNTLLGQNAGNGWTGAHWDQTDAVVMLARAFGVVHRRLAALPEWAPAMEGTSVAPVRTSCRPC